MRDSINDAYFEWMYNKMVSGGVSFKELLMRLHSIKFKSIVRMDRNRANDGINLRRRFAYESSDPAIADYIIGKCSVLEMMVALAIKIEDVMSDDDYGDRTAQWFWMMIRSLGLISQYDDIFDKELVDETITRFLDREYEPNGEGGLFTVKNRGDIRDVQIWFQMQWWMNNYLGL